MVSFFCEGVAVQVDIEALACIITADNSFLILVYWVSASVRDFEEKAINLAFWSKQATKPCLSASA